MGKRWKIIVIATCVLILISFFLVVLRGKDFLPFKSTIQITPTIGTKIPSSTSTGMVQHTSTPSNKETPIGITPTPAVNISPTTPKTSLTPGPTINTPQIPPTITNTPTSVSTSTQCPYITPIQYPDTGPGSRDNHVDILPFPQGCYIIVSSFNGNLIKPDAADISDGAVVAYQGSVAVNEIEVIITAGGGVRGFSNGTDAIQFYCMVIKNPDVHHGITNTAHSLNWAPNC